MSNSIQNNKKAYDLWSSFYDSYPNSTVAMDDVHFPLVWSHLAQKEILEIGCGTGRHTQRLVDQGNQVTGIDLSSGMLEIARSKLSKRSVRLIEADFMEYPGFRDESFDAIVCSLVVEHIKDVQAFFLKIAGLLRYPGEFFLSEIHPCRISKGSQAHFKDPSTQDEIRTTSYPHGDALIQESAVFSGMRLIEAKDVVADEGLSKLNPEWRRYSGQSMIKIWIFRK